MSNLVSILIFFLIFGLLVIVHEGGHFLIARSNNIRVKEFTIGLGPRIYHRKKGETEYSVRLLPFGGACIFDGMYGMEDEDEDGEAIVIDKDDARAFPNAKVWSRIATVFAGPVFNFILAYLIALIVVAFTPWDYPVITAFTEDSAAQDAGLREGDMIVKIDNTRIYMASEARVISQFNDGEPYRMTVERDGERVEVTFDPRYSEEDDRYYMGIYFGETGRISGAQIIPYAGYAVRYYFTSTWRALGLLIRGRLGADALSGPVGMVQMVDETYEVTKAYGMPAVVLSMLELTLLLSVNLGVMNLLPVPALDGGRLLFLLLEVVRGKPVPPEKEGYVHLAGIITLALLMVFVLYNDIVRIVS